MEYRSVNFATGRNGAKLKIDYSQKDFADAPDRLSFIDSKMFGVPFQGYDYYLNGTGGIKKPTVFRAVWNYPDERFVYFDGKIDSVNGVRVK